MVAGWTIHRHDAGAILRPRHRARTGRAGGRCSTPATRTSRRTSGAWTARRCASRATISASTTSLGRITGHIGIQRDITDRHLAAEELARSREELRALAAHLHTIREEERTRIARELHDELGQALTGLKLDLAWLERHLNRHSQAELVDRCANLVSRFDGVMFSMRRIITELRPSVLDELGLADAIEWQAHDFAARTGLALDLAIEGGTDGTSRRTVASTVFRMLQEALTNVAKHANASRVRVAFRIEPGASPRVSDDGRGITRDELRGAHSLGLLGLRERALAFGGTVDHHGESGQRHHRRVASSPPAQRQRSRGQRMIRILIVDDHPIVRSGLRRIAEEDRGITVTGEAASGESAGRAPPTRRRRRFARRLDARLTVHGNAPPSARGAPDGAHPRAERPSRGSVGGARAPRRRVGLSHQGPLAGSAARRNSPRASAADAT